MLAATDGAPVANASIEAARVTRRALGLLPDRPLGARVEGERGDRLRLALALAEGSAAARVVLRLGPQEELVDLAPGEGWRALDLPVPGPADLSLELLADAPADPVAVAVTPPVLVRPAPRPPTVLLITSDTHRADHLRAAGLGVDVDTPHLDALAAWGTLFEDAHSPTNITRPAHVSLFTGVHVRDHGIVDNVSRLADAAPTLAEAFHARGWATLAAVSAKHLAPGPSGLGQGFDAMAAPESGESDVFDAVAACLALLEEAKGRPAFVWLHLFDAHAPYLPRGAWRDRYWDPGRDPADPALPKPPRRPRWAKEVRDLSYLAALYRAEVSALDERLAAVLGHPRLASAVTAFTADHGEHLGVEDGFFGHLWLDRDDLHVPLVLAGPGVPAGARSTAPVTIEHVGRTLLDLAGLDRVPFPGRNLLADPGPGPVHRFAVARNGESVSAERGGWLLVRDLVDRSEGSPLLLLVAGRERLFDLRADPSCRNDLLGAEPARAADLRRALDGFLGERRELAWGIERSPTSAEQAELEALGYGGDR